MSERSGPSPSHSGLPGNHRLPSIPTLPPIEIPRSNFQSSLNALDSNSARPHISENDDTLSSSAQLSVESFTTACTSPVLPANAADSPPADTQSPTQTPTVQSPSMRSLPKSLSVDSFVREQQQQRDAVNFASSEPLRSGSSSKNHSRLQSFDPNMERRQAEQPSGRLSTDLPPPLPPRNTSAPALRTLAQRVKRQSRQAEPGYANISEDEIESSAYEDSEFEQGRSGGGKVTTKASDMRRRLTIPKRSGSMPVSRASSQLQGSRTRKVPGVSPNANLANINTAITTRPAPVPERSPQLRTKASAPTPLEATTRGRSYSVGTQSDDSSVKKAKPSMLLHVETEHPPKDAILMTLAVIGSRGCGKSSFIRRAWKHSLVTDAARHAVSAKDSDRTRVIHFITRKAYMQAHEGRDYYLTLVEIAVQELEHVNGELHDDVWPSALPRIDGAFVLYDASDRRSFMHTEELIRGYYTSRIPYIVLACKSDLPHLIPPDDASKIIQIYDGGIVEISNNDAGREKAKRCVGVLLRGVLRRRYGDVEPHLNPCSPGLYNVPAPWEVVPSPLAKSAASSASAASVNTPTSATIPAPSYTPADIPRHPPPPVLPLPPPPSYRSVTSSAAATALPMTPPVIPTNAAPNSPNPPQGRSPSAPTSPTRARSMGDMISAHKKSAQAPRQVHEMEPELNRSKSIVDLARTSNKSAESVKSSHGSSQHTDFEPVNPFKKDPKQASPTPWLTIEDLLEKLFFLSISGDDPSFISHFFLTYRRFTTPRRILLAMQKRMIELNQPSADFTLAAFAQMRICNLLEQWIQDYPSDFAVPGTAGALNALIRQILRQPHTLYYGSDFLPFLESLHTLQDQDSAWALKAESSIAESDESDSNCESEFAYNATPASSQPVSTTEKVEYPTRPTTRERKSSIPLSAKSFLQGTLQGTLPGSVRVPGPNAYSPARDSNSRLLKASNMLLHFDSEDIAKEITRRELELYMKIEPRDWLRHTLVSGKKDPNSDRIARFNAHYNDLHDWAASMILCHDRAKARARVVEKLAEVAVRLRNMNNYSGLRAIITAITQSTYPNDEVMEIFKTKVDLHKKYLSSDILMRTAGAHQSYRLALRNTKGPCIPCLEVHTSDLRRAHEGNPDYKPDDPLKLHWAKFNMIGKFVGTTTELQNQCRGHDGYNFPENAQVGQLFDVPAMDYDSQQDRLGPPPEDDGDIYSAPMPPTLAMDHAGHSRDPGVIKRLFFWS